MSTRSELFHSIIDIIQSGRSLDLVGEHGSGRTHLMRRVTAHFETLGWRTLTVTGLPAFRKAPLVALGIAGIAEAQEGRPSNISATVRAVTARLQAGRSLIAVDDWDALDDYSWGVITTVQSQIGVTVMTTRLLHEAVHAPALPSSGFATTYALALPGMGYAELETALDQLLNVRFDSSTLSRIFAKSGGNIGLAAAVVDAAERAGQLHTVDGIARASGSLWTPALRAITEVILQPLSREAIEALEVLSLLGPADIATASKVVSSEMMSHLEERSFLGVLEVGGSKIVSVRPPLVVEHFRHDGRVGHRWQLLARIDDLLASGTAIDVDQEVAPEDPAMFVRLVHEQTRRRTLQARESWQSAPSVRTATAFLRALEADGVHGDEIDTLISGADALIGSEGDEAEWQIASLGIRAIRDADLGGATAELRQVATRLGTDGGLLLGFAVVLELLAMQVQPDEPFTAEQLVGQSEKAQVGMLRARALWLLVRGDIAAAEEAIMLLRRLVAEPDDGIDALAVYAHIASERLGIAARIADDGLLAAKKLFDAPRIRSYAFLSALTAMLDRRFIDAERVITESSFLGLPVSAPPMAYIGLSTMAAGMAARKQQRSLAEQFLAGLDAMGLSDGPLPGQNRSFVYARIALFEEGLEAAADVCFEGADALWEQGAYLTAAYNYLDGMRYSPMDPRWPTIEPLVASVAAPAIATKRAFTQAIFEQDAASVVQQILDLESLGRSREALYCSTDALRAFEAFAPSDSLAQATAVIGELRARLQATDGDTQLQFSVKLTPREREIAELIAAGMTNAVIAKALVLSVRTVESHVNRLLRKAGLTRRQDIKEFLLTQSRSA